MSRIRFIASRCAVLYTSCSLLANTMQRWNSRFFVKTTLQALGFVLQVGHPAGTTCSNPRYGSPDFAIIHMNGIHPTTIAFCACDNMYHAGDRIQQLLRYELYPAMIGDPSTCFTFRMLEHYSTFSLQCKLTGYDYYLSLQHLTDNAGLGLNHVSRQLGRSRHCINSLSSGSSQSTHACCPRVEPPESVEASGARI